MLHIFYNSSTLALLLEHKLPFGKTLILVVNLLFQSLWSKLIAIVSRLNTLTVQLHQCWLCCNALIFETAVLSYVEDFPCCQVIEASSLIPRMPHVTACEPQKLISLGIDATSNEEPPNMLRCLGKQNLRGNEESIDSTPSLANKVFPSITNSPAGQQVSLQGIHHKHFAVEDKAFQSFEEEEIFSNRSNDANLDIASAYDLSLTASFGWSHIYLLVFLACHWCHHQS